MLEVLGVPQGARRAAEEALLLDTAVPLVRPHSGSINIMRVTKPLANLFVRDSLSVAKERVKAFIEQREKVLSDLVVLWSLNRSDKEIFKLQHYIPPMSPVYNVSNIRPADVFASSDSLRAVLARSMTLDTRPTLDPVTWSPVLYCKEASDARIVSDALGMFDRSRRRSLTHCIHPSTSISDFRLLLTIHH